MAHNLEIVNGKASLVLADRPAWHDLGDIVEGAFSWQQCIEKNKKLDYEVTKEQLGWFRPNGEYVDLPVWGIFRTDNHEFLGPVGSVYNPIQIRYAFEMCDTLLEVEQGAHYESAGVLGKGERFFVTARLPNSDINIGDDMHQAYLMFTSSHDGSSSAIAKIIYRRVVCNNTLTMALRETGSELRVKHTTNADVKLDEARKMMSGVTQSVAKIEEKFNQLAMRKLEKRNVQNILNKLFKVDVDDEVGTRKKNTIIDILDLYADNDGNAFPEQKGTAFNLFNAMTNWSDHKRGVRKRNGDTEQQLRSESALFGVGESFKHQALRVIEKETRDCAVRNPTVYSLPTSKAVSTGDEILNDLLNQQRSS